MLSSCLSVYMSGRDIFGRVWGVGGGGPVQDTVRVWIRPAQSDRPALFRRPSRPAPVSDSRPTQYVVVHPLHPNCNPVELYELYMDRNPESCTGLWTRGYLNWVHQVKKKILWYKGFVFCRELVCRCCVWLWVCVHCMLCLGWIAIQPRQIWLANTHWRLKRNK